jgi:hypothetical protein
MDIHAGYWVACFKLHNKCIGDGIPLPDVDVEEVDQANGVYGVGLDEQNQAGQQLWQRSVNGKVNHPTKVDGKCLKCLQIPKAAFQDVEWAETSSEIQLKCNYWLIIDACVGHTSPGASQLSVIYAHHTFCR